LFDRYFRLTVSDEELSQATVQKLLGARGDREQLRTLLQSLNEQGRLNTALEELPIHEDELQPHQAEPYITAIFDVGDLLPETRAGGFEVPIQWRVSFLVQHALEKISDVDSRTRVFSNALDNTTGLSMALEVVAVLTSKAEKETADLVIPEEKASEVRACALQKIAGAAASGALADSPRLGRLLHLWRSWGDAKDAIDYTDKITSGPDGTMRFLKSMELRSYVQQMGDYAGTERYYFQRNDIEPLISMDKLSERANAIPKEALDDVGVRAVENFQKAMVRRSAGRPDSGPFVED